MTSPCCSLMGRTAPASLPVLGLALAVSGGAAISHVIQTWYATIFHAQVHGWKAMARRAEWLAGRLRLRGPASRHRPQNPAARRAHRRGQRAIPAGRRLLVVEPALPAVRADPRRQLFHAGLATAICYTGLGVYITYIMPSSTISNGSHVRPIGTVIYTHHRRDRTGRRPATGRCHRSQHQTR